KRKAHQVEPQPRHLREVCLTEGRIFARRLVGGVLTVFVCARLEGVGRRVPRTELEQRGGGGAVKEDHPALLIRDKRNLPRAVLDMQPGEGDGRTAKRRGRRGDPGRERWQHRARVADQSDERHDEDQESPPNQAARIQYPMPATITTIPMAPATRPAVALAAPPNSPFEARILTRDRVALRIANGAKTPNHMASSPSTRARVAPRSLNSGEVRPSPFMGRGQGGGLTRACRLQGGCRGSGRCPRRS